ncbi:hypothetical protein [Rhizobium leguminosarum]|uniref:hypothetical protein n=1 Tax=Rhizobium leguminosarum TaxID=384 RepID=UPI003F9CEA1F
MRLAPHHDRWQLQSDTLAVKMIVPGATAASNLPCAITCVVLSKVGRNYGVPLGATATGSVVGSYVRFKGASNLFSMSEMRRKAAISFDNEKSPQ